MALSESLYHRALREFSGVVCPGCEGAKKPNNGFCSRCYFSLSKEMQKSLWQRFGHGYEESHDDARDWLHQERRAKQ